MKEWQKTPTLLLSQYCQKKKRPRPRYDRMRGGGPRYRVVLQDPSKPGSDKDLLFTPKEVRWSTRCVHCARLHAVSPFAVPQSFPDDTVAKNGAALLALHYLEPARQYDRMFPEPYKSLWQALSSKGARMKTNPNAAGASASTSSKPMSARARKKEESKQQAHICEKCGKAFKKAHGLATHDKREHPPPKKVPGQESDDDDDDDSTDEEGAGAGLWGGGGGASTASTAGTSSAPPPPAAAPPLPAAPSVPITLTSQSYFASKFDRRKDALERQKKKSKRKGTNKGLEMANRDPTIMMGDRHRATVESLLEECGFGASYIASRCVCKAWMSGRLQALF